MTTPSDTTTDTATDTTTDTTPSGAQHELAAHGYRAVVTEVGASLRLLTHDGRDLVVPWSANTVRPLSRGAVLAPWPNRVADGCYTVDGVTHQLPLTEPDRGNAIHGLVQWTRFEVRSTSADAVTLGHRLVPQTGYPWELDVEVGYRLGADGLHWTVRVRNLAAVTVPYGVAPHPYLRGGSGALDSWTVTVPAARYLDVTPDRLLPRQVHDVDGTTFDLRRPTVLGDRELDHALTGVPAGSGGLAEARVVDDDGVGTALRWDPQVCPWVQVHTADRPEPENNRVGLAVEPMTCPPDAFSSGTDVVRLTPGAEHEVTWQLVALP